MANKTFVTPVLVKRYELQNYDPACQPDFSQFENEMHNWEFFYLKEDNECGGELRAKWVGPLPREIGEDLELYWAGHNEFYWGCVREQE